MARQPVGMPTGVEVIGNRIRIRFMRDGKRCCETLPLPTTPQGISAAASLRTQVVQLAKLGMLTDDKYVELFPRTSYQLEKLSLQFGQYAQTWLDSREVKPGTRRNYKNSLNKYWMPSLATVELQAITPMRLRKIANENDWPSPQVKRSAIQHLRLVLKAAVQDDLITRNPAAALELPRLLKKSIDPFELNEAEQIIDYLYATTSGAMRIYAAYFEFAFFTGMRMGEVMGLRWDEIDTNKGIVHVCRIVVDQKIEERTKTGHTRLVMLNSRAQRALAEASKVRDLRRRQRRQSPDSPYVFPPAKNGEFIQQAFVTHKHFTDALKTLGIRRRPQYNCRHTYATMCLMAGMNPAFIAKQLGHSVKMLLDRYAHWMNSDADWSELEKLESRLEAPSDRSPIGIELVQTDNEQQ